MTLRPFRGGENGYPIRVYSHAHELVGHVCMHIYLTESTTVTMSRARSVSAWSSRGLYSMERSGITITLLFKPLHYTTLPYSCYVVRQEF